MTILSSGSIKMDSRGGSHEQQQEDQQIEQEETLKKSKLKASCNNRSAVAAIAVCRLSWVYNYKSSPLPVVGGWCTDKKQDVWRLLACELQKVRVAW